MIMRFQTSLKSKKKEQKKKLDRLKISSLMITGKLLSISPEVYYRLEKTEKPFLITGEFIKAGLLFKFKNGKIKLKEVLESKNIFERNQFFRKR